MAADALQIFVFPLFAEGALSPADDVLDLAAAAVLVKLLGFTAARVSRSWTFAKLGRRQPGWPDVLDESFTIFGALAFAI